MAVAAPAGTENAGFGLPKAMQRRKISYDAFF
jgi:hypothetical protein